MSDEKIPTCSHSCTDCGVLNCLKRNGNYPEFCPTAALTEEEINEVTDLYIKNRTNRKIAIASAEVEGGFYGKYTRTQDRRKEDRHCNLRWSYRGKPNLRKDPEAQWL